MTDKGGATKHTLPRRFDRFVGTASVLAVYTKHFLSRRSGAAIVMAVLQKHILSR